jgi:hypothetical protein
MNIMDLTSATDLNTRETLINAAVHGESFEKLRRALSKHLHV